eukprot:TRINITY_DN1150_c1_g1_i2.p2 TRINITY_DN1150_c1_g1~~TRINITY_DN1150_c1_g1_i2.p2  ORF type:complete len:258 (+),score=63.41 TRINITY_DN1150_c1_g1_i2:1858-2631(+)
MDSIRALMGVCPQHDILWEELTGRDHLHLFGAIRGMDLHTARLNAQKALDAVGLSLHSAGDRQSGTYSGGMKRRLSVAMACMGDPKIIYMDEPTTGLDPVSRHEVWDVVQRLKASGAASGRVIILTTHNMEEADVLADRVAVLSAGVLRCVGDALHLKAKYGRGYRLTVVVDAVNVKNVIDAVAAVSSAARVDTTSAGSVTFSVPADQMAEIPKLVQAFEARSGGLSLVKDWGLSHTTLEDVFLRVTLGDAMEHGAS